jgi:hypothetical protein
MQQLSTQELNDLLRADDAIQNFLHESLSEGNEFIELEKYVSELDESNFTVV